MRVDYTGPLINQQLRNYNSSKINKNNKEKGITGKQVNSNYKRKGTIWPSLKYKLKMVRSRRFLSC